MLKYALVALAAMAPIGTAQAATTIASNGSGDSALGSSYAYGQSFTVNGSDYDNSSFSFQNYFGNNVGQGKLYLFLSEYRGAVGSLASSAALGVASFSSGSCVFDANLRLIAGKTYYAYTDTRFSVGLSLRDVYAGGNIFYTGNGNGGAYSSLDTYDSRFMTTGTAIPVTPPSAPGGPGSGGPTPSPVAAVPEPATWALMILGFGLVGGTMRRRRDQVTVRYA